MSCKLWSMTEFVLHPPHLATINPQGLVESPIARLATRVVFKCCRVGVFINSHLRCPLVPTEECVNQHTVALSTSGKSSLKQLHSILQSPKGKDLKFTLREF